MSRRFDDLRTSVKWGLATPFVVLLLGLLGLAPVAFFVIVVAAVYGVWDMTWGRVRRRLRARQATRVRGL